MKTYGIICEYNPFHNGHIHQIEETRKHGATHIVAVMSGNYVQRGDIAQIDKFKRAEIAVKNGVDLVIEMPTQYSLANAELFARCGVMMLASLRCVEGISFGSECGNIEELQKCANAVLEVATPANLKPLMDQGMPYPEAVSQLVSFKYGPLTAQLLESPNNILAVEYLKSIKALGIEDKMEAFTIKREGAGHDSDKPEGSFASGSYIRQLIDDGEDISAYVPKDMADAVAEYDDNEILAWYENLERMLLYRLRTMTPADFKAVPDVGPGLENRLFQAARMANSMDQLLELASTKRYPTARFRRIFLNALLGIRADDLKVPPVFGRILALNDRGAEILRMAGSLPEDKFSIPFSSNITDFAKTDNSHIKRSVGIATVSSDIYTLASRNIRPCGTDFTAKIFFDKLEDFKSELPEDLKTTAFMGSTKEREEKLKQVAEEKAAAEAAKAEAEKTEDTADEAKNEAESND